MTNPVCICTVPVTSTLIRPDYVSEWIFPDNAPPAGLPGSLNTGKYAAAETSQLTSYWPTIVYQSDDGNLSGLSFDCSDKSTANCWHKAPLRTTAAKEGTPLAIVPLRDNLTSTTLFYQQEDGKLVSYEEDFRIASRVWTNRELPPF